MAQIFEQVDLIVCATNPDVAFGAEGPMPTTVDGVDLIVKLGFEAAVGNNGALTIPANTTGHPAVAIPIGLVDGLPVSMQIIGRRHAEAAAARPGPHRRTRATVALGGARRANPEPDFPWPFDRSVGPLRQSDRPHAASQPGRNSTATCGATK